MSHTVGAQTTNYTWDIVAGLPVALQDGTNTYVYGLDLISSTDTSGTQANFLYDGLGSTTGLTDGNGSVTDSYTYDVFGGIFSQTGTSGNYWLFTGEQRDTSEGLYYLRARYYDPAIGRFLSQDPLRQGNAYAYVGNNPIGRTDRSGLCFGLGNCGPVDDVDNVLEDAYQAGDDVVDYGKDKTQDSLQLAANCVPIQIGCTNDVFGFGRSILCEGDRKTGPGGWVYYENAKGFCARPWKSDPSVECATTGYITFCQDEPSLAIRCHEYQHYIQSRIFPFPLSWILPDLEEDARNREFDKESKVPYTDLPWPIQCE